MNTVAIAGKPKRSSCRTSRFINTPASIRGPDTGAYGSSHPVTPSAASARSGSKRCSIAARSMVRCLLMSVELELLPARGAPNAQLRAAQHDARKLEDEREDVGACE